MDPLSLSPLVEMAWLWVAAPIAILAGIVLAVRMRLPQLTRLGAAFRAVRAHDPKADGTVPPATSIAMGAVAAYGGAAAVGAATAVALGGPGAIAWVWLFGFLLAPLRVAEAALARTAPPGQAGKGTGTLAGRLIEDPLLGLRVIGWILMGLVPLTAFAFVGGVHGGAVLDAAEQLHPDSALPLGLAVAAVGGLAAVLPMRKAGSILGWIGAVALIALFGAGLFAFVSEPGRGFGAFGRGFSDLFYGASGSGAFTGALAGEIAMAALLHLLPPLASVGAVEGAWHSEAQAPTTKSYVWGALAGPAVYVVLTTLIGFSLISTNAFARPVEGTRPVRELTFYRIGFDSVSQRMEEDRRYDGFIRVTDGETGVVEIRVGNERGMIRNPTFEDGGEPADLAMHVHDGVVDNLQKRGPLGALENRPFAELDQVHVRGRMLPRGGTLLSASMAAAGGSLLSRIALAALLLLAALGAAAWGFGVRKTLGARLPENAARAAGLLPGLGVALAAAGAIRGFGAMGLLVAAALVTATSIALIVRAQNAADLSG